MHRNGHICLNNEKTMSIERKSNNVHAALCFALWYHQGGSSPIGQQIRPLLGLGQHERMTDEQVQEAKRVQEALNVEQVAA